MSSYNKILTNKFFDPPGDWLKISTIDMHTAGEPLRVVLDGFPKIEGDSILQKRRYVKENHDHLRTALMFEPRGHADMYGCLLTEPERDESAFGIIFMHNEGYSTMCGHATIAIARLAVEMNWIEVSEPVTSFQIDAPCGPVKVFVEMEKGKVVNCKFQGVPSFMVGKDLSIDLEQYGSITYDIAYGGAFYAYVDINQFGITLNADNYQELIRLGKLMKKMVATKEWELIKHPFEEDLSFLYGTIFIGPPGNPNHHSKNVCVFADGEVDRSPTGSGVSGRMAIHHTRGEIAVGERVIIESILRTTFATAPIEALEYGGHAAVIPEVAGTAHITGSNSFVIDPHDPLKEGFILR